MGVSPNLLFIVAVIFGLIVVALVYVFGFSQNASVEQLQGQGLWPQAGQTATDADIKRLAEAGHKIPAIKMYRIMHGVGLREAKDAVEAMVAGK